MAHTQPTDRQYLHADARRRYKKNGSCLTLWSTAIVSSLSFVRLTKPSMTIRFIRRWKTRKPGGNFGTFYQRANGGFSAIN